MNMKIATTQLWVHDQDEALDFWTKKVGLEVRTDITVPELGNFRWLTVGPAGQPEVAIVLMAIPGPPVMDDATSGQVRELLTKGAVGGALFFTTEDAHATFAVLKERGVEVTDQPETRPYGIDFGIRDPFGNAIRIGQMFE